MRILYAIYFLFQSCPYMLKWLFNVLQVINHDMTPSFLDEVREVTKQFFALPMEEKRKYSREADGIEGYGNDKILSEKQILNWSDRLYITLNPEQRKLKFWPENPKVFR